MFTNAFDEVNWPHVHRTLNQEVPRLFQVWACKQVMNIAATNKNLSRRHRDGRCDKCPCCMIHVETAAHVLLCPEVGRVEAFQLGTVGGYIFAWTPGCVLVRMDAYSYACQETYVLLSTYEK
jgi:hypothetical protein